MSTSETFGETIKRLRKECKMTQKMLSQGICAQSVLSRIENGVEIPNVMVLQSICQRLNVTLDQVLLSESEEIQRIKFLFSRVHYYLIHQEYQKMEDLLGNSRLMDHLYLDTDFQLYYYYLGSCEYFLYQAYDASIQSLKKGLSYTYNKGKENSSSIEIQLLSCLGRVFGDAGNIEKASFYLETSYELIELLPTDLTSFELTKVFYNYGSFLFQMQKYEQALEVSEQGILWAQQRCSHYYLEELFSLSGVICQKMNLIEESKEYLSLATYVSKIR